MAYINEKGAFIFSGEDCLSVSKSLEDYLEYQKSITHLDLNEHINYGEYKQLLRYKDRLDCTIQIAIMKNQPININLV